MIIGLIGHGYWGKNVLRNLIINEKINSIYVHDINLKKNQLKEILIFYLVKKNFLVRKLIFI